MKDRASEEGGEQALFALLRSCDLILRAVREGFGEWEYLVLICVLQDPSGCWKEHRLNILSLEAETGLQAVAIIHLRGGSDRTKKLLEVKSFVLSISLPSTPHTVP